MSSRATTARYEALCWLTVVAALSYLCRNAPGMAEKQIRDSLGLTLEQSGWFMGAFFWTYAICQIPSGSIAQQYGTRLSLTTFAVAWSMAAMGIGLANGFWFLVVAQLVMGVAQAGIFPAACNSIGHWIPVTQRSFACGVLTSGMQIGAILAGWLAGALVVRLGWRWMFVTLALPGFVWAIGFYIRFRDRPEQRLDVNEKEISLIRAQQAKEASDANPDNLPAPVEWRSVLSNPALWLLCGQQACRAGAYNFFPSWFPTYLQEVCNFSIQTSGLLQGVVLSGTLMGSLVGGLITDWVLARTGSLRLSRSAVGATSVAICSALFFFSWLIQSPLAAVVLLASASFFAAVAGPCAFAVPIDLGGTRVPQVFGLMNMCGNIAAALCPILVGIFFQKTANWTLILPLFSAVYLVGAICWAFLDPNKKVK